MRRAAAALLLVALATLAAGCGNDDSKPRIPKFSAPVVDAAGVLDEQTEEALNAELLDYQDRTENQIAVALVDTTGGDSIEDYTIDLAREWGVGKKGDDNGAVLLLAIKDREMRIEVGRGLEGDLTDLESGRIIRDVLRPRLRAGDYGEAVGAGIAAIRVALGDTTAAPPATVAPEPSGGGETSPGWASALVSLLIFGGAFTAFGLQRRGRRWGMGGPIIWGGGFGGGSGWGGGGGGGGFGGGGGGGFGGGGASGDW